MGIKKGNSKKRRTRNMALTGEKEEGKEGEL